MPLDIPLQSERRAHLPLRMGGLGLSPAREHRHAAYWASWADTVTALQECHPGTLAALMRPLLDVAAAGVPPSVMEAEHAAQCLRSQGYNAPTWATLLEGTVPPSAPTRRGWQQSAGAAVDKRALEMLFSDLDSASRALLLSQSGEGASCAITAIPSCPDFVVDSGEFRTFLLRRLRLALPLAPRRCRCGGTLDELGDHRSACAQVGVLAHRAGPLERAAARICREAGARVATSVALRDLNLDVPATDGRRIEVVAVACDLFFFIHACFATACLGVANVEITAGFRLTHCSGRRAPRKSSQQDF